MLCDRCDAEMKEKEQWRIKYPKSFICPNCYASAIMYESGLMNWRDENGNEFSPKGNFGSSENTSGSEET